MTAQLTLQPESSAARTARRWVEDELTGRSRSDLLESAVLGVSELVTNALLHVRGTISVRIVDADSRLRIEVHDDSPRPAEGRPAITVTHDGNLSTIGRGLQIVDSISLSWGVAYEDASKCVWFQPRPDGVSGSETRPDLPEPHATEAALPSNVETVAIELIDVPVELLVHYRIRFRDLRRELTLIALRSDHRTPHHAVGDRLNEVALRLESFGSVGVDAEQTIDAAVEAGKDRTNVRYDLPVAALPGVIELRQLLLEADEFCRTERLLTLEAGPQENAMRAWYLGELVAQAGGAAPTPWPGEFVVTDRWLRD